MPRPNLLEGSSDTAVDLNDPTLGDRNIMYVAPQGVEQLFDQWLGDKKDVTLPGTDVNEVRGDISENVETNSRDK